MTELTRRDVLRAGGAGALGLWLPFAAEGRSASWHAGVARGQVGKRALGELRRRLHGALLLLGDRGYGSISAPANARFDRVRPLGVARCLDERDVSTCIDWSRAHEVQPVARGGGHSYAGYSTTRGLLIDLRRIHRVKLDKRSGIAVIGGGAANQDVFDATVDGAFVLPGGTCLGVGVGGLVLGGGIGYNTHWAGLTCDHLVASRIVTADGQALDIDKKRHRDLFWACRGGAGGSFGINTRFTFRLPRVPRKDVAFYRFDWRGADAAAAVLSAFDKLLTTAPPALNAVASAQASPVGPGGPREAIDVFSRGQYIGPLSELRELVQPLITAAGEPAKTALQTMTYWDMQRMFESAESERHAFGDVGSRRADRRSCRRPHPIAAWSSSGPARTAAENGSMWSLGWVGGRVVGSVGRRDTAYVHRDVLTLLRPTPVWKTDSPKYVRDGLIAWGRSDDQADRPTYPRGELPELPESGDQELPASVLRGELLAAGEGQDQVRPGQRVPQRTEHPAMPHLGRTFGSAAIAPRPVAAQKSGGTRC
jgi:FAD binding domain